MAAFEFFVLTLLFSFIFAENSRGQPKIVGGEDITITQAPYQLSLRYNETHICGASIIHQKWALSAAHCFIFFNDYNLVDLRSGSDQVDQGGKLHPAAEVYVNPNYELSFTEYDVALIFTKEPFEFSDVRQPILLATSEPQSGDNLFLSGWGLTDPDGASGLPTQLQGISIPFVDRETCEILYGGAEISERVVCAGTEGKSPCVDDSGGPLVFNDAQIGIVSYGACGVGGVPAVFTNLANSEIRDWVQNITGF